MTRDERVECAGAFWTFCAALIAMLGMGCAVTGCGRKADAAPVDSKPTAAAVIAIESTQIAKPAQAMPEAKPCTTCKPNCTCEAMQAENAKLKAENESLKEQVEKLANDKEVQRETFLAMVARHEQNHEIVKEEQARRPNIGDRVDHPTGYYELEWAWHGKPKSVKSVLVAPAPVFRSPCGPNGCPSLPHGHGIFGWR